jgi:hypothetical protein
VLLGVLVVRLGGFGVGGWVLRIPL